MKGLFYILGGAALGYAASAYNTDKKLDAMNISLTNDIRKSYISLDREIASLTMQIENINTISIANIRDEISDLQKKNGRLSTEITILTKGNNNILNQLNDIATAVSAINALTTLSTEDNTTSENIADNNQSKPSVGDDVKENAILDSTTDTVTTANKRNAKKKNNQTK